MEKQTKSTKVNWSGFSKKAITERLEHLENNRLLSTETLNDLKENTLLSLETANQLTENVLGTFSLPFSVAPDFQVDGATFNVPIVA
ncbi:3-hydroxy-3-methylglutaryl-coenzyme A reductase [Streptococcus pasteurianus]|nr:3-hydroxy-3-methylglutaryl-coenzyme A reductase [Streptococcus pasteurianus]